MTTVTIAPVRLGEAGLRNVTALMGASPPLVTSSGGWVSLARPKRLGFTSWEGFSPRSLTVDLLLDGVAEGRSQQSQYDALVRIMRRKVGPEEQPSPVRVLGPAIVGSLSALWVIQSVTQDPATVVRSSSGTLLRAAVTVEFLEYVEADVVISQVSPSPAKRLNNAAADKPVSARTHTVKYGDTLSSIAAKYLGSWSRYSEIAELNGIRDPNNVPVGTVLKLP